MSASEEVQAIVVERTEAAPAAQEARTEGTDAVAPPQESRAERTEAVTPPQESRTEVAEAATAAQVTRIERTELVIEDPADISKNVAYSKKRCYLASFFMALAMLGLAVAIYFIAISAQQSSVEIAVAAPIVNVQVDKRSRINCLPDYYGRPAEPYACAERKCLWDKDAGIEGVSCYFDVAAKERRYLVKSKTYTDFGQILTLEWDSDSPKALFHNAIALLTVTVHYLNADSVRFKITDAKETRYEVPILLNVPTQPKVMWNERYEVQTSDVGEAFYILVKRSSSGTIIFDSRAASLLYEDQFISMAVLLPSSNIYGFGENLHQTFKHNLSHQSWPIWARDQAPGWQANANLYGAHPFYLCIENDTNSNGVLLLNSNAMDYTFTPLPVLTYRTIGGILDFLVFLGPTPENVVQQYTSVIGRPYMPPYWALGFQLCRYGYKDTEDVRQAVIRTQDAGIPHDVQYADIDYMEDRRDFTVNSPAFDDLGSYFNELRASGMKTIIMLDPGLVAIDGYQPYKDGTEQNIFIQWPNQAGQCKDCADKHGNMYGYVWPTEKLVFPDFFKNTTHKLWQKWIVDFSKEISFDGLWVDMNEPANFGTNEDGEIYNGNKKYAPWSLKCNMSDPLENPTYKTMAAYAFSKSASISDKTLCMVGVQGDSTTKEYRHYDVHSLYGWSQTLPTLNALRAANPHKRGIVITRSTFPGSGQYAGHWLGDNDSTWKSLRESIIGMLEFNLFGIPYVGADICGFWFNSTAELCQRWMELGAFYPFARNHNGNENLPQDPGYFEDRTVATASRDTLTIRYQLLPYLYTLFHFAHTRGNTVVRPLAHEWPADSMALGIDEQFLWGPALLISPILHEGQTSLSYYLPKTRWYDYYEGNKVSPGHLTKDVNRDTKIQLHVRGGHILPMKESAKKNTQESRTTPFNLLVALDEDGEASGYLFWDDGESIDTHESKAYDFFHFTCKQGTLRMQRQVKGYSNSKDGINGMILSGITVLGVQQEPAVIYKNEKPHYNFQLTDNKLSLYNLNLNLTEDSFEISWQRSEPAGTERIECMPHVQRERQTEAECIAYDCVWDPKLPARSKAPLCYINNSVHGYAVDNVQVDSDLQTIITLKKPTSKTFTFASISSDRTPKLIVEKISNSIIHYKFVLNDSIQYEVPVPLQKAQETVDSRVLYEFENLTDSSGMFSFKIKRKNNTSVLWDTSIGGLFLSPQYQQIVTRLPSSNIFGFGENDHTSLRLSNNYETWPMFARDQPPGAGYSNLYGVHPFYLCIEENGNTHGVLLWNSNAMEYKLQPDPSLTLRTIGGVLDFYMFLGPSPDSVIQQYTSLIGRPFLPPYWSLGFQLCRYGYNSLTELKLAVNRTTAAGIPLDVQYADIDHMDTQKDFTINQATFNGLSDYVLELKRVGIKFIIILDPALLVNDSYEPYTAGLAADAYVKWPTADHPDFNITKSRAMAGYVWPDGKAVFPDFFKQSAQGFWADQINKHHRTLAFDGLWIDMNEPANFGTNEDRPWNWPIDRQPWWSLKCPQGVWDNPPYKPRAIFGSTLADKTLCMVGEHDGGHKHYDVHNLYGWSQSEPTLNGLQKATQKRGVVISRSTYPSSGRFAGHWLGDNSATWRHMKESIIGIIEFNLFGIPYIGADICGFFGDSEPELCQRWMQLGAFYTFSRNHNGLGNKPQDPASFGPEVAFSSKQVLETRYHLLPYLYMLFFKAHMHGTPVIKALWHEYPADQKTWLIDEQFLWGPALLISPVLKPGKTTVDAYFPMSRWYNYHTGKEQTMSGGHYDIIDAPRDVIPIHVRGGYILPRQKPANSTHYSRKNHFDLLIALDANSEATGDMFWDDGDSIGTIQKNQTFQSHLSFKANELIMSVATTYSDMQDLQIDKVTVLGLPTALHADGVSSIWDQNTKVLQIVNFNQRLNDFSIKFSEQIVSRPIVLNEAVTAKGPDAEESTASGPETTA